MTARPLQAPVPLTDHHEVEAFASVAPTLDAWIRRKTRANQASGASRSYVLCRGDRVPGFYALAAGSVSHDLSPRKLRQNMPAPAPVIVLGRLAVEASEQGNGLGRALLRDAVLRLPLVAASVEAQWKQMKANLGVRRRKRARRASINNVMNQ